MTSLRTVIILVSALLLGGGILASPQISPVHNAAATTRTIVLVGAFGGWNSSTTNPNPTITVTQGDIITIQLTSVDTMHQFALDVDKDGTIFGGSCPANDMCSAQFTPTSPTSIMITASFSAGTYTYFCTFHSQMVGSFIVNPSTSVGGTTLPSNGSALLVPYLAIAATLAVSALATYTWRTRRKTR